MPRGLCALACNCRIGTRTDIALLDETLQFRAATCSSNYFCPQQSWSYCSFTRSCMAFFACTVKAMDYYYTSSADLYGEVCSTGTTWPAYSAHPALHRTLRGSVASVAPNCFYCPCHRQRITSKLDQRRNLANTKRQKMGVESGRQSLSHQTVQRFASAARPPVRTAHLPCQILTAAGMNGPSTQNSGQFA